MQLKTGDKIQFIDNVGYGIIIGFKNSFFAIVQDADGFEMDYHIDKLILVSENLNQKLKQTNISKVALKNAEVAKKVRDSKKQSPEKEIDLHIENLVDDYSSMTNYEMLSLQLNVVKRELNNAFKNKKIRRIIFIHGVGEGVLKHEILKVLQEYENLQFRAGSFSKYGNGATEVNFN